MKYLWAASLCLCLCGCTGGRTVWAYSPATGGDAKRGHDLIARYDCGSCHTIPGVADARGMVGPPLFFFGRRTYIAGELPNTPENLVKWIQDPTSVEPNTAMPKLGLTDQQARDVAAYLYTLISTDTNGGT
jgi:cytochrome c